MLRLYDFRCPACDGVAERLVNDGEKVKSACCGAVMERLPPRININMGPAGAHGYYDENLGTYVNTNRQRRELCRQQGVTPKGDTPKPDGEAWV